MGYDMRAHQQKVCVVLLNDATMPDFALCKVIGLAP